jgi:hypothetical protein
LTTDDRLPEPDFSGASAPQSWTINLDAELTTLQVIDVVSISDAMIVLTASSNVFLIDRSTTPVTSFPDDAVPIRILASANFFAIQMRTARDAGRSPTRSPRRALPSALRVSMSGMISLARHPRGGERAVPCPRAYWVPNCPHLREIRPDPAHHG